MTEIPPWPDLSPELEPEPSEEPTTEDPAPGDATDDSEAVVTRRELAVLEREFADVKQDLVAVERESTSARQELVTVKQELARQRRPFVVRWGEGIVLGLIVSCIWEYTDVGEYMNIALREIVVYVEGAHYVLPYVPYP